MRRATRLMLRLCLAALVLSAPAFAQLPSDAEAAQWRSRVQEDARFFTTLGSRAEGSSAEARALDRVEQRLAALGMEVTR